MHDFVKNCDFHDLSLSNTNKNQMQIKMFIINIQGLWFTLTEKCHKTTTNLSSCTKALKQTKLTSGAFLSNFNFNQPQQSACDIVCPWMILWANIDCSNDFPNKSKLTSQNKYCYVCFLGAELGTKVHSVKPFIEHSWHKLSKG